jgi:hypothetical protein
MEYSLDKDLVELIRAGVLDGFEVTKRVVENFLNVTLTDCTGRCIWHATYPTLREFRVIDPGPAGSNGLTLLINFTKITPEPVSFCFVNDSLSWVVFKIDSPRPQLNAVDFESWHDKDFQPFAELTRAVYLAEVAKCSNQK